MASQVEKYELILSADPRSRIFVDLGRALNERGDHERAVEVLKAGLVHHPGSVQARVLLGRAYLSLRRPSDAVGPLADALARAPSDARIKLLLDQAQASAVAAGEAAVAALPPGDEAPPAPPPDPKEAAAPLEAASPAAERPAAAPIPEALDALLRAEVEAPGGPVTGSIPLDEPLSPRPPRAPPPPPGNGALPPPLPPPPAEEAGTLRHLPRHLPRDTTAERKHEGTQPGLPLVTEEAALIAAKYEQELREKMSKEPQPAERSLRPRIAVVLVVVAVLSAALFWYLRRAYRAQEARADVVAARAGLARDTFGSLSEAARALRDARATDPRLAGAALLEAEVAAILWADFADQKALERARALATDPEAGEGALAARYLAAPGPAERDAAAEALVKAAPSAGPLIGVLAAAVLRGRGDREGAQRHLEAAARATPPMLRALADLADMARAGGDPEEALRLYRLALKAHPTHPRSVLGAAETRMALSSGLEESLAEVEAMRRDPQSKPPGPEGLRADLVHARLLFALGRHEDAVADLAAAGGRFAGRPEVPAAVAEMEMARGAFDRAEVAAERAVAISPGPPMKELLAQARLGRGRYRELLEETEGTSSRALRLARAQARAGLGEWDRARAEIEATRRDGRTSPEAAAWMAFCNAVTGRRAQALAIVQALETSRDPPPMAAVARGRLLAGEGKRAEAEQVLRSAAAATGAPLLAQVELASAVRAQGRASEAAEILSAALERNPFHAGARLERARARLEMGDARGAAEDARQVLEDHPRDQDARRLLDSMSRPAAPPKANPAKSKKPARRRR